MLVILQLKKKLYCSNFLSQSGFNVEKEHIFHSHLKCILTSRCSLFNILIYDMSITETKKSENISNAKK